MKRRNKKKHTTLKIQMEELDRQDRIVKCIDQFESYFAEGQQTTAGISDVTTPILQILTSDATPSDRIDLCLSHFMDRKILEKLCKLIDTDNPHGARDVAIQNICVLLDDLPNCHLLDNEENCGAVSRAIALCLNRADLVNSKIVQLLESLTKKILRHPTELMPRFFKPNGHSVLFSCLSALSVARSSLLLLFRCDDSNFVNFLFNSSYCEDLVGELIGAYKTSTSFETHLKFCCYLMKTAQKDVAGHLLQLIQRNFFKETLEPALIHEQQNLALCLHATNYVRRCILCIDSPVLLNAILEWLVKTSELRNTLVQRIFSQSAELVISTLQLFERLLTLHHQMVFADFVFEELRSYANQIPPKREAIFQRLKSYALPGARPINAPLVDSTKQQITQKIQACVDACKEWKSNAFAAKIEGDAFQTYDSDGLFELTLPVRESFLRSIMRKLRSLLREQFAGETLNRTKLTGELFTALKNIYLKLLHYPVPQLYLLLLDVDQQDGPLSLLQVLNKIGGDLKERMEHFKDCAQKLNTFSLKKNHQVYFNQRTSLSEGTSSLTDEEIRTFECVLVLEDFQVQMLATSSIWEGVWKQHVRTPFPTMVHKTSSTSSLPDDIRDLDDFHVLS
eukprot:TRINITY_DN2851_c0_g1_i2.p1 TRINITY_DN2851_c0_g1~~TRINITY_DN2851_c0_g1_i2.p1  ORF type:complete len:623 (+),score=143.73 TRINITY_DN2851_c0_g1_i2:1204-3072(+)